MTNHKFKEHSPNEGKDTTKAGFRPLGIKIATVLMILFGAAEIATAFTHSFFGISTSAVALDTYLSIAIGSFYAIAGALIFTMRKWAGIVAVVLLIADIMGRLTLVVSGLFPMNSVENTFSIITGTIIAALFAIYILSKLKSFR